MLTKYKITVTVTPNNVLILLNQCFDNQYNQRLHEIIL